MDFCGMHGTISRSLCQTKFGSGNMLLRFVFDPIEMNFKRQHAWSKPFGRGLTHMPARCLHAVSLIGIRWADNGDETCARDSNLVLYATPGPRCGINTGDESSLWKYWCKQGAHSCGVSSYYECNYEPWDTPQKLCSMPLWVSIQPTQQAQCMPHSTIKTQSVILQSWLSISSYMQGL